MFSQLLLITNSPYLPADSSSFRDGQVPQLNLLPPASQHRATLGDFLFHLLSCVSLTKDAAVIPAFDMLLQWS